MQLVALMYLEYSDFSEWKESHAETQSGSTHTAEYLLSKPLVLDYPDMGLVYNGLFIVVKNELTDHDNGNIKALHWRIIFTTGIGFFTDAYDLFIIGVVTTNHSNAVMAFDNFAVGFIKSFSFSGIGSRGYIHKQ